MKDADQYSDVRVLGILHHTVLIKRPTYRLGSVRVDPLSQCAVDVAPDSVRQVRVGYPSSAQRLSLDVRRNRRELSLLKEPITVGANYILWWAVWSV